MQVGKSLVDLCRVIGFDRTCQLTKGGLQLLPDLAGFAASESRHPIFDQATSQRHFMIKGLHLRVIQGLFIVLQQVEWRVGRPVAVFEFAVCGSLFAFAAVHPAFVSTFHHRIDAGARLIAHRALGNLTLFCRVAIASLSRLLAGRAGSVAGFRFEIGAFAGLTAFPATKAGPTFLCQPVTNFCCMR